MSYNVFIWSKKRAIFIGKNINVDIKNHLLNITDKPYN